MTSDALTAATVAAVRQQMCNMVAAAQHHPEAASNLVGFNLPQHHTNMNMHQSGNAGGSSGGVPVPKLGSPAITNQAHSNNGGAGGIQLPRLGSPAGSGMLSNKDHDLHGPTALNQSSHTSTSSGNMNANNATAISNRSESSRSSSGSNHSSNANHHPLAHLNSGSLSITRLGSPASAHDLRMTTPPTEESPLASPMGMALEPAVNLAVGGGHTTDHLGMQPYGMGGGGGGGCGSKSSSRAGYSSSSSPPRPEHLFQDQDIAELVANARAGNGGGSKDSPRQNQSIKVEPMTECRGE